jgi:hypothetical protein
MAIVSCKECNAEVSTEAKACPRCGASVPQRMGLGGWLIGGFFAFVVGSMVMGSVRRDEAELAKPAETPAQAAARSKADLEMNMVLIGARRLRDGMKKPETFELTSAVVMGSDAICYEYTARNSFNDRTSGYYVITKTASSSGSKDWNRWCAGKRGTDYTYVRAVM